MARSDPRAVLAALLVALGGCGDNVVPEPAAQEPRAPGDRATPPGRPGPKAQPDPRDLLGLLVPKGVPTEAGGRPADPAELAVVKRWLRALTRGDVQAAADTFADGTLVQNLEPPIRLRNRAARIAFNASFPCGAEIVDASSVRGYLVVTYRLTDRVDSPCDGPGGKAAGTIRVKDGKMTEWYRLPNPPAADDEPAGPVI